MADTADDVLQCIRALVGVIQQAGKGVSPVDEGQLAHVKKLVKVLSLSQEQIQALPEADRSQLMNIRHAAITKMKTAKSLQNSQEHQLAMSFHSPPTVESNAFSAPQSRSMGSISSNLVSSLDAHHAVQTTRVMGFMPPPAIVRSLPSTSHAALGGFITPPTQRQQMPPPSRTPTPSQMTITPMGPPPPVPCSTSAKGLRSRSFSDSSSLDTFDQASKADLDVCRSFPNSGLTQGRGDSATNMDVS